jgi:hypothetical protein
MPFGASNVTERFGNASCIVWRFLEPSVEIRGHLFGRAQVFRNVVRRRLGSRGPLCGSLGHGALLLIILGQLDRQRNVLLLRQLVASGKQQQKPIAALRVVDAPFGSPQMKNERRSRVSECACG